MPKQYCPSCGAGTDYTLSVPKFCSQCGGGFGVAPIAQASSPVREPLRKRQVLIDDENYYDEEEDESTIRRRFPKKLDITVDPIPTLQKTSLESMATQAPLGLGSYRETPKLGKRARKEKVTQFRQNLQTTQRHDIGGTE